jgi:hypothetical protein
MQNIETYGSCLLVDCHSFPSRCIATATRDLRRGRQLSRVAPEVLDAVKILKPETIIRWHRAGFRAWWRWKSRPRGGRPRTPDERFANSFVRRAWPIRYGALPASTVNSLSSAWMSARPPWRSPWRKDDGRRRRAGGPLFTITPVQGFPVAGVCARENRASRRKTHRFEQPPRSFRCLLRSLGGAACPPTNGSIAFVGGRHRANTKRAGPTIGQLRYPGRRCSSAR